MGINQASIDAFETRVREAYSGERDPAMHLWIQQWITRLARKITPYRDVDGSTEYLLNLGAGWSTYRLKDDLPDECKRALEGMNAIRILDLYASEPREQVSDIRVVINATYVLGQLGASLQAPMPPGASPNEQRDRWIYEQAKKGKAWKVISRALQDHPEWEQLESPQGVRAAVERYIARHNLPKIQRQPGRPKN